jgi:hypothetical protein
MSSLGETVDRNWVQRFIARHDDKLKTVSAKVLPPERHFIERRDVELYFGTMATVSQNIPSHFIWNEDETRVGTTKQPNSQTVIVATTTTTDSITYPSMDDSAQMSLIQSISVYGEWTMPYFLSKNQTFEKSKISELLIFEGTDY